MNLRHIDIWKVVYLENLYFNVTGQKEKMS